MKMKYITWMTLFFLSACSSLPEINEDLTKINMMIFKNCHEPFLKKPETNVHSIHATMRGRKGPPLIGITTANPKTRKVHSALMTIEGLVLFEAVQNRELKINRAVRPFDSESFAKGMMDDINLIFFKPDGKLLKTGVLKNGNMVCRYEDDDRTIDVIDEFSRWTINVYSNKRLKKRIQIFKVEPGEEKGKILLKSFGESKYVLEMELIRKEKE